MKNKFKNIFNTQNPTKQLFKTKLLKKKKKKKNKIHINIQTLPKLQNKMYIKKFIS